MKILAKLSFEYATLLVKIPDTQRFVLEINQGFDLKSPPFWADW